MSKAFPTHKQFIAAVRARLHSEYPGERGQRMHDTVKMQSGEQAWLKHLGDQIKAGIPLDARVLNVMTPEQLYSLHTIYAPENCLDAYFLGKLKQEAREHEEAASVISCYPPLGGGENVRVPVEGVGLPHHPIDDVILLHREQAESPDGTINVKMVKARESRGLATFPLHPHQRESFLLMGEDPLAIFIAKPGTGKTTLGIENLEHDGKVGRSGCPSK